MTKVKITILKTDFYPDLAAEYGKPELGPCTAMKVGDVFYADVKCPEGFFYNDWSREPGLAISSCNDGFRPVIFKLEATDIPSEKGK